RGRADRGPSDGQAEVAAEGGEVGAVDEAVTVEVEGRAVVRVRRLCPEGGAEEGKVRSVDEAVAADVAEEAVQLVTRRRPAVGKREVVATGAVAVAVQLLAVGGDLTGQCHQGVPAVGQRAEGRLRAGEAAEGGRRRTVDNVRRGREAAYRPAADACQCERGG